MNVQSAPKYAGALLAGSIVVCALNYAVWRVDSPHSSWGDNNLGDYIVMAIVFSFIALVGLTVQRRERHHAVRNLWIALFAWLCTPPIVAFALWNSHITARTLFADAWYWTLQPLPIDIAGAFSWEPAVTSSNPTHGVVFSLIQLATIALTLSSIAIYIDEYRRRGRPERSH